MERKAKKAKKKKKWKKMMKTYEDLEGRILPSNIFHCTNFKVWISLEVIYYEWTFVSVFEPWLFIQQTVKTNNAQTQLDVFW